MNRIDRLIAILTTLQSKRNITAKFIADKYEISERTVYRDLKALGEIGVPINFENDKGYSILQGFFLPPISLTNEEANSLILISKLSEKFTDKTTKVHIENAIAKITASLRTDKKEKASFLQSQIKVYIPPNTLEVSGYLTELQNAIVTKQILQITYTNNKEVKSIREIEPIGLTFYSNQWHLIAWCWEREAYRDFKVKKINQMKNLMKTFIKSNHLDINDYIKLLEQK
ncbi:WYL domain-containing protein [uncultured Polaribacter sp.]|uniref:helix-turn-helix transcriptional regulator n=1 Tax=uncultured Polaribacter sp. TaxID=174711 RepID=UPI00261BD06B|nr:WYL domain-containing protein [uncultured Polaribacter sp.]